jgi:hypothetical protein
LGLGKDCRKEIKTKNDAKEKATYHQANLVPQDIKNAVIRLGRQHDLYDRLFTL